MRGLGPAPISPHSSSSDSLSPHSWSPRTGEKAPIHCVPGISRFKETTSGSSHSPHSPRESLSAGRKRSYSGLQQPTKCNSAPSTPRGSFLAKIKRTTLSGDNSPRDDKKVGKQLDRSSRGLIETIIDIWNQSQKPDLTADLLRNKVERLFYESIVKTIDITQRPTHNLLYRQYAETKQSSRLFAEVHSKRVLLNDVLSRLEIFHFAGKQWLEEGGPLSEWGKSLVGWLQTTLINGCKEHSEFADAHRGDNALMKFLDSYSQFVNESANAPIAALLSTIFGDSNEEASRVFQLLKMWSVFDYILFPELNRSLERTCAAIWSNLTIPFQEREIELSPVERELLETDINGGDVVRSLKPEDSKNAYPSRITINGKDFHRNTICHDDKGRKHIIETPEHTHFIAQLLGAIYQNTAFEPKKAMHDQIADGATHSAKNCSLHEWKRQASQLIKNQKLDSSEALDQEIPCMPILRSLTDNSWALGEKYIMRFFAPFFTHPYWLKIAKDTEIEICTFSDGFEVTQIKSSTLYQQLDLMDKGSYMHDYNHPLAEIPIAWTISLRNKCMTARLQIQEEGFKITPRLTSEIENFIYETLKNFSIPYSL
jgi:hypothetical protein